MVQIVPTDLTTWENVAPAPVDDLQRNAQALHHRGAGTAQIVRRPRAVRAAGQQQHVAMLPVLHRLARRAILSLLKPGLPITDLLAD